MTSIPKELHDLLAGGHNVWVATVDPDGMPNVSIKGSGALLDDEHLYFADMFSRKTRENLARNPRVAVGIHDPERKVAMQVKGRAELIDRGEVFDTVNEKLKAVSEQLHLPPMKYVVRITVESVWDMGPGPHAGEEYDVTTGVDAPATAEAAGAGPAEGQRPLLDPAWYDAIAVRRSRRRYSDRKVAAAALGALRGFCDDFRLAPGARVALVAGDGGIFTGLLDRFGGAYGRVEGAPWTAAFIAPKGGETQVGYVGEAFILEATRLGLGTCWVAGMFDRKTAASLVKLHRGEHVMAVTPVGHPVERRQFVERMMSTAVRSAARRQVEAIAPGLTRGLGHAGFEGPAGAAWPAWAVAAVEAARVAPSGANKQPWRFRLGDGALVMGRAEKTYWTAPIDFGIAMLHVELGAAHEGVHGAWEHLAEPDVARFIPDDA